MIANIYAKLGAAIYVALGVFHACLTGQMYALASAECIAKGRMFQLAASMLTIALFVVVVASDRVGGSAQRAKVVELAALGQWEMPLA